MSYEPTAAENAWADAASRPATAALCVQAAAAINRLDAALLSPLLAEHATYGAQSVIEEMAGRDVIVTYFTDKFVTLREAGPAGLLTAELATAIDGAPCALLRQRASAYGTPGLGPVIGYWSIAPRPDGSIGQLLLVTSVPPPERCVGSGLFPGLPPDELERHRAFAGQRIPLSPEVTFLLFAKARVGPCDNMVSALPELAAGFQPARFRVVTPGNRATCIEHGVTGFPTLIVQWRGETVFTVDGYRTNEQLREALAGLFER